MQVEITFKNREKQSMKDNLTLYNRAKNLKERALKLIKQESEDRNENTNS